MLFVLILLGNSYHPIAKTIIVDDDGPADFNNDKRVDFGDFSMLSKSRRVMTSDIRIRSEPFFHFIDGKADGRYKEAGTVPPFRPSQPR
jgi:hypothetical protein